MTNPPASPQALAERVRRLFTETFHVDAPDAGVDLLEQGILDSLQFAELLVRLEETFDVRIHLDQVELDDLRTLDRIARLVQASETAPTAVRRTRA